MNLTTMRYTPFCFSHDIVFSLTCPYTYQQNGHAERVLRTLNDSMRIMLLHSSAPSTFWPDALATSTYLLNCHLCRMRCNISPYELLLSHTSSYDHLRVFGSLCYPNIVASSPYKLARHSVLCIFLGYPAESKGYRCYNLKSRRVITSRHVTFDESIFPFRSFSPPATVPAPASPPDVVLLPPARLRCLNPAQHPDAAPHITTPPPVA
jgi:hypothetical protein